jgi:lipopolysaccharide transport system permease protein
MSLQQSASSIPPVGTSPAAWSLHWRRCCEDIAGGLRRWQLWWLFGLNDIRQRYRRSRIGQFWITLSMGVFIVAIGPLYASLFTIDLRTFLPHLTANFIVWTFIAAILNESCLVFIQAEPYLRQERLPKTIFIMRIITRNLLVLAHNAILIPLVFLVFATPVSPVALLALPGLVLLAVNAFLVSLFLGTACARFRDLPQIVGSIVQIGFFVSPIVWQRTQLNETLQHVVDWNPFASHLGIVAGPLLGQVPSAGQYLMCLGSTAALAAVAVPFFARFRARIVYWL